MGGVERGSIGVENIALCFSRYLCLETAGSKNKLVCNFKLTVDIVGNGFWNFINYADGIAFLKWNLLEFNASSTDRSEIKMTKVN